MHGLEREVTTNGTQSARFGGIPPFFCKECDSKVVPASILQECDCKGVLADCLQEYDPTILMFCWTKEPWGFCKDGHRSNNRRNEGAAPESRKLDLGTDDPRASDAAVRIASMFYFTARVNSD